MRPSFETPAQEGGLLVRKWKTKFRERLELENRLSFAVAGPAGGQLRTTLMDDIDMIFTMETLY